MKRRWLALTLAVLLFTGQACLLVHAQENAGENPDSGGRAESSSESGSWDGLPEGDADDQESPPQEDGDGGESLPPAESDLPDPDPPSPEKPREDSKEEPREEPAEGSGEAESELSPDDPQGQAEEAPNEPAFVVRIPREIDFGEIVKGEGTVRRTFTIHAERMENLGDNEVCVRIDSQNDFHLVPEPGELEAGAEAPEPDGAEDAIPYRLFVGDEAMEPGGVIARFGEEARLECCAALNADRISRPADYRDTLIFEVALAPGGAAESSRPPVEGDIGDGAGQTEGGGQVNDIE